MNRIIIIIAVMVIAGLLVLAMFWPLGNVFYEKTFDAGEGRRIRVFASCEFDVTRWFSYEIYIDGVIVEDGDLTALAPDDRPDFRIVLSADRQLIGIYEQAEPSVMYMIHDYSTGENWPNQLPDEHFTQTANRGKKLLGKLQESFPEMQLMLYPF